MAIDAQAIPFVSITIGNAVAALAFTIAIQQFLRPIHRFRLAARGIPLHAMFVGVYLAAGCVLLGNSLRYVAASNEAMPALSAALEVIGGTLFFLAYLGTTFISLSSARFREKNARRYARAAYRMLTKAEDSDYVALFQDVSKSVVSIARLASFNENYRWAGLDHGEPSAFYDFIHRRKIDQSYFAGTLLHLLTDARCCEAIIRNDSASVIELLREIKSARPRCDALSALIQALAKQAIVLDDSMLAREVGYTGFAAVRAFLDEMFGDSFIARQYEPLQGLTLIYDLNLSGGVSDRLAAAVERTWKSSKEIWHPQSLRPAAEVLKSAIRHARLQEKKHPEQQDRHFRLYRTVATVCEITDQHIAEHQKLKHATSLFADEVDADHHTNIAGVTADLAVEALMAISNDFAGIDDPQWSSAINIMRALFDSIGSKPDGLSPVQQRALILIIDKLGDNMRGYYPALTRVMLAMIGPYRSHQQANRTAFRILEDAAYGVWKDFGAPKANSEARIEHFLPPNVKYVAISDTLIHTYRSGEQRRTRLTSLELPSIDPLAVELRRDH